MPQDLNAALHKALDEMGAPREDGAAPPPVETVDEAEEPEVESTESDAPLEAEVETSDDDELEQEDEEAPEEQTEDAASAEEPKYRVNELAEAIGWDAKDLYENLQVPFADGTVLSLGELKAERDTLAQRQSEIEQARAAIAEQYQQLSQAQQQAMSGPALQGEVAEAIGQMKAIEAQYANVDWDSLDKDDPGRAANLRQRFATAYAQAQQNVQQKEQEVQQKRQQYQQEMLQRHNQAIFQLVPEWKSPEVYNQEAPGIYRYLLDMGFNEQELMSIYDARARAIARDAWQWRTHQAAVTDAKKKVRQAPKKVMRPGKHRPATQMSEKRLQQLEQRALQTQKPTDKLAAAREIFAQSRKQQRTR